MNLGEILIYVPMMVTIAFALIVRFILGYDLFATILMSIPFFLLFSLCYAFIYVKYLKDWEKRKREQEWENFLP